MHLTITSGRSSLSGLGIPYKGWVYPCGLLQSLPLHADRCEAQVEPGKPDQFCTLMDMEKYPPLSVAPYLVAWRVEIVDEIKHRGFEYVR